MRIAQVRFSPWDKSYDFYPNGLDLKPGDKVLVKTELGSDVGEMVSFSELPESKFFLAENDNETQEVPEGRSLLRPIKRKMDPSELVPAPNSEQKASDLDYCREARKRYGLDMKFVDSHYAYDGSKITFAFIADGRIDFRELVKDLTRRFGKSIRLQQIGIRDEAKICGDLGHCGKKICCRGHLRNLSSVTSEMAEAQQCAHRGSDRLSGACGRLMCCLAYEFEGYKELAGNMPPLGARVNVDGRKGTVVAHHILKQAVSVEFPAEAGEARAVMEIDLNRHKKKKPAN